MSICCLSISFTVLVLLRIVGGARPNVRRRPRDIVLLGSTPHPIRDAGLHRRMLVVPVSIILGRTFKPGFGRFGPGSPRRRRSRPLDLSLVVVAVVVPLNVVFGVLTSLLLARGRFRGRAGCSRSSICHFAVSPSSSVWRLILRGGSAGALGFVENDLGINNHLPAARLILVSIFVTLPFVVREVQPVLQEVGTEQEQAAATLVRAVATFWRITLPTIRWV